VEEIKGKAKKYGSLEEDEDYINFLKSIENPEPVTVLGTDKMLEEIVKTEAILRGTLK